MIRTSESRVWSSAEDLQHNLFTLTGNLQAITREVKSFDRAIKILVDLASILTDHELGLEMSHALFRLDMSKEQVFLWFWGMSSLAKLIRENFGFDSPLSYVAALVAKTFSGKLETQKNSPRDDNLLEQFLKNPLTPNAVKEFLKKCVNTGYGNYVAHAKVSWDELKLFLQCLVCFEKDGWIKECLDNIVSKMKMSESES